MKYLIAFQKQHNLVPDGILGIKTLCKMQQVFNIKSNEATAHFVAQIAHETQNFKRGEENLNYSVTGLLNVFSKYFPNKKIAKQYARKPVAIANRVYANRMGNGDEHSGEGWLYRGRGAIQLTGKENYKLFSLTVQDDLVCAPNLAKTKYFFEVALWFFNHKNLWQHCHHVSYEDVCTITKKINGGYNGLEHRYNLTKHYYKILSN